VYSALPEKTNRPALEPAQIPTDRLRRYWANGDDSPLYAVVGHPVAQSRSPYVHSEWIRAASLRGIYVSLDVADDAEFLDVIPALAESGLRGINVTHPFKRVALTLATRTNPSSEVCRCANMLTFDRKEVIADNTDLIAVLRRLSELRAAGVWEDDRLTIVGTGGAARAALAAAHELRVQAEVLARDPEQAAALGRSFGATTAQVHDPNPVSLLVHATPVGQLGFDAMEIALDGWIGNGTYVLDFVYSPASTWLFDLARRNGAAYEDGWRLLVYQAAASFEIWWGVAPDAKTTDRLLEES
jgi:shikimate dehydrogenase